MDLKPLVDAIKTRRLILFVGSGASRPLGLPSWDQLIGHMGSELGFEPEVFKLHAEYLELAEYYEILSGSLGKLRSWMDTTWHKDESRVDASRIHAAIVGLGLSTIYTTNYDRWLEIAFRRKGIAFDRVANVADIAQAKTNCQIVKLHGDFENDESLVLTEHSYFDRLMFDSPLDIQLRSDSLGRGILFVGYSLTDINIRYLLYKLHRLWESVGKLGSSRPKSYMFLTKPNRVQEAVLRQRGIESIVSDDDDSEQGLTKFLEALVGLVRARP